MATTGAAGKTVYFYRSTVADLSSENLSWELVGTTSPEVDDDAQQTLQFLREGDSDMYPAGVRGHPVPKGRTAAGRRWKGPSPPPSSPVP